MKSLKETNPENRKKTMIACIVIFLLIMIISLLPKVIKAQSQVKPSFLIDGNLRRGLVIGAGANYSDDSNQNLSMDCHLSWSYPITSFGLTYVVRPINGKWGQVLGFGFDALYFYKSKMSLKTFFSYGANGSSAVTDPYAKWQTKRIAFAPLIEISAPIRKCRIGARAEPFLFGFWGYDSNSKKWTQMKQYYSLEAFFSFHL